MAFHSRSKKPKDGIVQIAKRLGVSPSTVSRALRQETAHLVSPARRKEILDLADKLRFSPNPGARILRRGLNATLTVVVPLDENIFFSEFYGRFLAGSLHAAAARNWDVHICALRKTPRTDFREALQHLGVDSSGIIYLAEPLSESDVHKLQGYRRPLVLTRSVLPPDVDPALLGAPVVGIDNTGGAGSAANLLLQLGHRKIALLLGPSASRDAKERKVGYLDTLRRAGTEPPAEWIFEGPFNTETGRVGMAAFLKGPGRPTGVCCANDEIAFGAIEAIRAAGLSCPHDVSVVGFDDGLWATVCRPALTTVRQPLADLAERAVSLLVEAATRPAQTHPALPSNLAAALVIRDSTQVPARA
jgi:LacI family transcriptional regulator, repressor for deo operon, udp, cdd, tsx, nupC, and nupG